MIGEILRKVTKNEYRFIFTISALLVLITSFPTIYGYITKTSADFFPALHSSGPGDYHVYYSYIEQAKQGNLIFKDLFTGEEHSPFIFNPLWLSVGLAGKTFNLPNILSFQLTRVILIFPFVFVLYMFISYFVKEAILRKYCLLFSIFASGLGGFFIPFIKNAFGENFSLRVYPMDLWVSEGQSFLTLYHSPHFILATLLLVIVLISMYFSFIKNSFRYALAGGLAALLLFFFHPFHLITVIAVLAAYLFISSFQSWRVRWDYLFKFIIFLSICSPALIYHFFLLAANSVAAGRAEQNICLTTNSWVVLISYGLLLIFSLWALVKKTRGGRYVFLATWLVVQSFLIFSPLSFQRRLTQGLQIPLTIFAFWGLYYFYLWVKKKKPRLNLSNIKPLIILLLIVCFGFSNLYVLAQDLSFYTYPEYRQYPDYMYLNKDYKLAFDWLYNNLTENDVIISDTVTGSFIAGFSGKRIFIGHWVETLNWREKIKTTEWFYTENGEDAEKREFLESQGITHVFYSEFEKREEGISPEVKEYLIPVFKAEKVLIYRVL